MPLIYTDHILESTRLQQWVDDWGNPIDTTPTNNNTNNSSGTTDSDGNVVVDPTDTSENVDGEVDADAEDEEYDDGTLPPALRITF